MSHRSEPENQALTAEQPNLMGRAGWFIRLSVVGYGCMVVLLIINESRLVYPVSRYPRGNWQPDDFTYEDVHFEAAGTALHGWYLPRPAASETILICHGNGENVAQASARYGTQFGRMLNANVFVFDYRGYGKSAGHPSEAGILQDTTAAMKWLNDRTGTKPSDVIVVGHSIGGGPAVHVASTLGAKALVLQRTFSSLVDVAAHRYWFVPVRWLMRNRYPSSFRIRNCDTPLHQCHGDCDQIVPIHCGRELFASSPASLKTFFVNPGMGHLAPFPAEYWESVKQFIASVNDR